jgi:phosphatidylethanolamine/phosphatidyl-N-methylethanolamine N-methyltransferase
MNNRWNAFVYACWAPVYDVFFNRGLFYKARKTVFEHVRVDEGSKVLFVGVGTGADLAFFPLDDIEAVAIDFSRDMLEKAKATYPHPRIKWRQMDAESLALPDDSFDLVVASLIVTVVPNPERALAEMARVAKRGGRLIIFDKFAPKRKGLSPLQKALRPLIRLLGTDIGVSFEALYRSVASQCELVEDEEIMMRGLYRKIVLKKR